LVVYMMYITVINMIIKKKECERKERGAREKDTERWRMLYIIDHK